MSKLNLNKKLKGQDLISNIIGKPDLNNDGDIKQIKTYLLIPFKNHPFKLYEGEKLNDLVESIKGYGILSPVIAREVENQEELELLSGHNRVNAAKIIGLETVPTIIKNVDDDTAHIIVAEANFKQRHEFLPSERAKAYKMQLDALKRQGKKRDLCSNGTEIETSREEVAKNNDTSAAQIRRYIRLNYLTDVLLDMVDNNKLSFRPAVEISYLSSESQQIIESLIRNQGIKISLKQAGVLKEKERKEKLDLNSILVILSSKKKEKKKLEIPIDKVKNYFDYNITDEEMVKIIIELLENNLIGGNMKTYFAVEELTLIKNHKNINANINRNELIEILENSIEYSEEDIIREWMSDTVEKLKQITDEEFKELDFAFAMDAED